MFNFKGLANIASLVKNAREIGGRMQEVTEQLKSQRTQGTAGGGMVTVEVNGLQEILGCQIDPQVFEQGDREFLEDLITSATNQALQKAREMHAEALQAVTGGMNLPGLDDLMGKQGPDEGTA